MADANDVSIDIGSGAEGGSRELLPQDGQGSNRDTRRQDGSLLKRFREYNTYINPKPGAAD